MGGSDGYRRLPGGSDDFSWQTNRQTLHHYIYIIMLYMQATSVILYILLLLISPSPLSSLSSRSSSSSFPYHHNHPSSYMQALNIWHLCDPLPSLTILLILIIIITIVMRKMAQNPNLRFAETIPSKRSKITRTSIKSSFESMHCKMQRPNTCDAFWPGRPI